MAPPRDLDGRVPTVLVHGGAGADPAASAEFREGVAAAALAGWRALGGDGSALDAVEAAVRVLEDHPRFNAGRGSVLTSAGTVEMDASIMEGERLACGAVAGVSRVANPITLARRVMEDGRHVLMIADGAHAFARSIGLPDCDPELLITDRQRIRLAAHAADSRGTVGAVAVDRHGTVAAATSTGGMIGKRPGRVGDSALIGSGTYADNRLGAVSCTGSGEAIIRVVLARRTLDRLVQDGDPDAAARAAVELLVKEGRGEGGLILVDPRGRVGYASSTALMPVAWMSSELDSPRVPF